MLTPEEAADYLKVSPFTVKDWLREGKLPGLKLGRYWRIRYSDLQRFLDERRDEQQGKSEGMGYVLDCNPTVAHTTSHTRAHRGVRRVAVLAIVHDPVIYR